MIDLDETDLDDSIIGEICACGFKIDENQRLGGNVGIHRWGMDSLINSGKPVMKTFIYLETRISEKRIICIM